MMCFQLKNINPCLLISTKNHAKNIIGLINKIFSKKEMGEEEEKGSVITTMMLVLNGHLQCPEQKLLEQQVITLRPCASRWTEVCDGIES